MKLNKVFTFKLLIGMFPTALAVYLLLTFYPDTGLGRIIAIPNILLVNTFITFFWVYLTRKQGKWFILYWVIFAFISSAFTISQYPQDYGPHVSVKIWNDINRH